MFHVEQSKRCSTWNMVANLPRREAHHCHRFIPEFSTGDPEMDGRGSASGWWGQTPNSQLFT
jgi:hypothetical protein